ncbi:2-hydroxypenta-2,4-dienoate hydratase (plasmid) [Rhodococcus jostii RHA1]|uniref:2-hydroxypenta-2,4-dienoate hydratase n=1 Tax=Rhodococcus jostii (strain RHA1) TaxID=101510 RepID=Q0RXC1_RHOJR|nr:2-keto-4-pentenoate hydratase [Rhodococcus jostii]ABH00065.1 2-hydroxypenta-2,4-dienoate hydratase [Rhodococcus jostii RHA1]
MIDDQARQEAAEMLASAENTRQPIDPLVARYPGIDVVDAYEIQLLGIRRRVGRGARIVGHKVGLSSKVMQDMMNVDEPDYGHLLDDMMLTESVPIAVRAYCAPRVEVEVGFILGADLPGSGCVEDDVIRATTAIVPSIELIDSRIANWQIKIEDTIADNASSAGVVLGRNRLDPSSVDLTDVGVEVHVADATDPTPRFLAKGRSDAVLGNPATSVAWLANKVSAFGVSLRAGDLVLPGSLTRALEVHPGDTFTASFGGGLGMVTATFI